MDTFFLNRMANLVDDTGWGSPASILQWVSLPRVTLTLTRVCLQPQTDYTQLRNLLQYDPALLCRYLFTLQKASTVPARHSIPTQLQQGNKQVLSRSIMSMPRLDQQFPTQYWEDAEQFLQQLWLESLQCAHLSRAFARMMELPDSEEIYFAGLLYRCGELALLSHEKRDYLQLVQCHPQSEQRRAKEFELYQITAPQLSQCILQQLGQPQSFLDAALFHELSTQQIMAAHPVTRLVHVAHQIVSGQIASFSAANRQLRNVLGIHSNTGEMLLESALNQSFDVVEALGVQLTSQASRQQLLPWLPDENNGTLAADLQQLRAEQHQIKNILSITCWQKPAQDKDSLLEHMQQSAYLLFGCRQLILFRYDQESRCLQGEHPGMSDAFESALCISLQHPTLASLCFQEQKAITSFEHPTSDVAVLDLELMQYCHSRYLVALPISQEGEKWGCLLMAFDADIQSRFNLWQGSLLFFAQQMFMALHACDLQQHWQNDWAQLERTIVEQRFKRLSHEINNPLTIAQNHLHILRAPEKRADPTLVVDHVDVAIEQVSAASRILLSAMERLNVESTTISPININELIQDVLYLFSTQSGKELNIFTNLDERLPAIYIDEHSLRQVLINLIKNALECCEQGTSIRIKTQGQVNIQGVRHVAIQVQDDGPGLPECLLDNLFVDTCDSKKGPQNGMGLTIVKELVEEMGGLISFQRYDDTQSLFTVYLPVSPVYDKNNT